MENKKVKTTLKNDFPRNQTNHNDSESQHILCLIIKDLKAMEFQARAKAMFDCLCQGKIGRPKL